MKQQTAHIRGKEGEKLAETFLIKKGYTILDKNFICNGGELDIIAKSSQNELVFIEVKHYTNTNWTHPLESITKAKQKRILKAAKYYLFTHNAFENLIRFDAIIITSNQTQHLENIFIVV